MDSYHRLIVLCERKCLGGHILPANESKAIAKSQATIESGYYSRLFPGLALSYKLIRTEVGDTIKIVDGKLTIYDHFLVTKFAHDGSEIR